MDVITTVTFAETNKHVYTRFSRIDKCVPVLPDLELSAPLRTGKLWEQSAPGRTLCNSHLSKPLLSQLHIHKPGKLK